MKLLFLLLLFPSTVLFAQQNNSEDIVRRVANHVIENTSFEFKNNVSGAKFSSTQGMDTLSEVRAASGYNKWAYVNAVINVGMIALSNELHDEKYADYAKKNYAFIFDNVDYFKKLYDDKKKTEWASFFRMNNLDACGSMAAALADVYEMDKRKDYRSYLDRAADYILHKQQRLPDGTLCRPDPRNATIWADDLYMSVPFLARMARITGEKKYFDDAIKQVENFNKYLYDPTTGLFFHCWYSDVNMNGVARWGRCNGWIAMATVQLLNELPADHPKRAELIKLLLRQIVGYSRYQDVSGLWHQILDKPDSYLESSVTAMFVYTVARAVNEGWINKSYFTIAQNGWKALTAKVTSNGEIPDVCVGTGIADNIEFYYERPKELNDPHAIGAFLLTGTEMIRAESAMSH